ncbi:oxidoreductase fad-binding domain-containing protein [Apiospora arundinis]
MAAAVASGGWHTGERAIQQTLLGDRERPRDNPTYHGLAPSYGYRVQNSPLVAFGALDRAGRPWTTIWGGEAGFCRPVAQGVLGVRGAAVDAKYDPVLEALFGAGEGGIQHDEVVRPEGGKVMSGLSIDLETRDRVKLAGRLVAGAVSLTAQDGALADLQMAFQVTESLGNCPKYLNKKHIVPHVPRPQLTSQGPGLPLSDEAIELVHKADLFFISTKHGASNGSDESMDTNHRGGPAGLLRVFRNNNANSSEGGVTLVYPEYSGNRLYQTLGNLQADPSVGLAVPDFETGDVLYLTGKASILIGDKAAAYLPRTKLAVRIDVQEARFVKDGLPFRGSVIDYSPYNPPVRRLATEMAPGTVNDETSGLGTARLLAREEITPTISRYRFQLSLSSRTSSALSEQAPLWHPGQHVTLDFGPELDHGWSHMRDDDPQSLNDDFVRTFTVSSSSVPSPSSPDPIEFEITARRHGPATGMLSKWNLRVPLELPVLGFGGEEAFRLPLLAQAAANDAEISAQKTTSVFVAGGVGITPLMAQASGVLSSLDELGGGDDTPLPLKVLWSLRREELALAVRVVEKDPGLGKDDTVTLFVTGATKEGEKEQGLISRLEEMGVVVKMGRIERDDILGATSGARFGENKRRFFCCTGPELMKRLLQWTEGEDVVFESFQY